MKVIVISTPNVPVSRLHARADAHAAPRRTAGTGSAPGTAPAAALDLDARGLDVALLIPVVKFNVVGVIAADAGHFSGIELALSFKISLDPVALARLLRALRATAARARTASRTRPLLDVALLDVALLLAVVVCVGKLREK